MSHSRTRFVPSSIAPFSIVVAPRGAAEGYTRSGRTTLLADIAGMRCRERQPAMGRAGAASGASIDRHPSGPARPVHRPHPPRAAAHPCARPERCTDPAGIDNPHERSAYDLITGDTSGYQPGGPVRVFRSAHRIVGDSRQRSLISDEEESMPQVEALSTELLGRTEDLIDAWGEARTDGRICPVEMARVTVLVGNVHAQAGIVDLAQAAGLAVIRRGTTSRRPGDLLTQLKEATTV